MRRLSIPIMSWATILAMSALAGATLATAQAQAPAPAPTQTPAQAQSTAQPATLPPLRLVQTFPMPPSIQGHFDHFGVDIGSARLFSAAEGAKAVLVFDLATGQLTQSISGIAIPHAILYRHDLDRLYVTDGGEGALKIFDGKTYGLLKRIPLFVDADSIVYGPASHELFIVNGGGDAHQSSSTITIVDTTKGERLGDIEVDGDTLEAMAIEEARRRLYANNRAKNRVELIDLERRTVVASWPVTRGKVNVAMALDEKSHRLFVACRSGQIVVMDTETGKELQALAIDPGVDDLVFDPASGRLYASCGDGAGSVAVYKEVSADRYELLGKVPSGPGGRTARLVPELNKYYVAVPAHGDTPARVLVFAVQ